VHHQVVSINAERYRKRVFDGRKILIELSEQAEVIGEIG